MTKGKEKFLASFIALLFLLPVGAITADTFGSKVESVAQEPSYDFSICLKGKFDPLKEAPNIPSDLKLSSSNGYYLLQVKGPVLQEWQDELKSIGVINYGYVSNFAYIVWMNDDVKAKAEKLPFVRWIGNFEPGYKI
ncbi:MAG: hypothetical protein QMD21_06870, partial [Candidatus Thermoplasmatota archaeon]|nr:hypothetical protein [Candidatus Thermoplasmatota archaeon]